VPEGGRSESGRDLLGRGTLAEDRQSRFRQSWRGIGGAVEYFQPDAFIAYLKALKSPTPQPSETQYGGYKVKRSIPKLSAQEQKQKEDIANRAMAETMRRR
jgi:hypothetical protein